MFRNIAINALWIFILMAGLKSNTIYALADESLPHPANHNLCKEVIEERTKHTPVLCSNIQHQQPAEKHNHTPPSWLAIPFILLLCMIASGPLLYEVFWHKHYPKISILLSGLVISYYLFVLHNYIKPTEALMEYIQFIALISALYMASGGILINVNKTATPIVNLTLLWIGAILANFIGTTGASMLLIRPYVRLNQDRIKTYHIVFFIFIVSNVGGALTPIGDPPLFLGFLKGVPFFWTLQHNLLPWLLAILMLSLIFFWLDNRNVVDNRKNIVLSKSSRAIEIVGKRNFIWLLLVILAVFVDPNIFDWVPAIHYHGHDFSFVRELLLLLLAWFSYRYASRIALQSNAFSFAPIKEVVLIFVGIFGTMMPALTLISNFAQSEAGINLITHNSLYWGAGIFSSVLDNAPTYLNFVAASMASQGADILQPSEVYQYAMGQGFANSILRLKSISVAAVFFGAMTYIGNGPNFMVKSIAEQLGVRMPAFFNYIVYFAIPFLLPILFLVWLICFYLQIL
ncbi:MAG: sodium:proton antiporter [Candidatus Amoebophilus sp.]